MSTLFNNLLKTETWGIAADLKHIRNPFPSAAPIKQTEFLSWDRIGGCALLALSMFFVITGCFYLYWASRKVEHIGSLDPKSVDERTQQVAKLLHPAENQNAPKVDTINVSNLEMYSGDVSTELQDLIVSLINHRLKSEKCFVSNDIKILIYSTMGRTNLSTNNKISEIIKEKGISFIINITKDKDSLISDKIGEKNVYKLTYDASISDEGDKEYSFPNCNNDMNMLFKDANFFKKEI